MNRYCHNKNDPICRKGCAGNAPCPFISSSITLKDLQRIVDDAVDVYGPTQIIALFNDFGDQHENPIRIVPNGHNADGSFDELKIS